ncbi:MAG: HPr family phosphocarrier protein [Xanthomonadales bacterium]|nr:HPr family phosphocarrier protein [Xanthomonadales bacterium]
MISRGVTIVNRLGLHARAAARLVNCAARFEADVWLRKDEQAVNGKSIMGVLTLAAGKGSQLTVEADGPDEEQAVEALAGLVRERFGEDE